MLATEIPFTGRIHSAFHLMDVCKCVCVCVSVSLPLDLLEAFKTHQRQKLGHTEMIMQSNAFLVKT